MYKMKFSFKDFELALWKAERSCEKYVFKRRLKGLQNYFRILPWSHRHGQIWLALEKDAKTWISFNQVSIDFFTDYKARLT